MGWIVAKSWTPSHFPSQPLLKLSPPMRERWTPLKTKAAFAPHLQERSSRPRRLAGSTILPGQILRPHWEGEGASGPGCAISVSKGTPQGRHSCLNRESSGPSFQLDPLLQALGCFVTRRHGDRGQFCEAQPEGGSAEAGEPGVESKMCFQ